MPESHNPPVSPRVFTVEWDVGQKKFIARNDGREMLGMAADRANAIGIAIRGANSAGRVGGFVAVKVLMQSGKYRTEYITQPGIGRP
ncbi:MAG: hypothetical protein V4559_11475 [Pseudomonadota bacterium]